jgi:UPF0042 nucleotide-binding protein
MRIIVVSGLSGSGKTIALQTLEDLDCYCVDNLPFKLVGPLAQEILNASATLPPTVAIGVDARNFFDELSQFPAMLAELRASGLRVDVLFLQADDEVLLKRYSETRRRHPLDLGNVPLREAIRNERHLLGPVVACADLIIDTSDTNLYQLRELIHARVHEHALRSDVVVVRVLWFQKRGAVRRRFHVRCPLPAQSTLGAVATPPDRARSTSDRFSDRPCGSDGDDR